MQTRRDLCSIDAIKKMSSLPTIFPAAVGRSAAAMLSRYRPLRADDFLMMSLPPEARSTVFFCLGEAGGGEEEVEQAKKKNAAVESLPLSRRFQCFLSVSLSPNTHAWASAACAAGCVARGTGCRPRPLRRQPCFLSLEADRRVREREKKKGREKI